MKTAIYPGSFNPWHDGHDDVLRQALRIFDKVIIAVGQNPDKPDSDALERINALGAQMRYGIKNGCIEVVSFKGLLAEYVSDINQNSYEIHAVIRGLRNAQDFEYEKVQLYHNQDLKIGIPTVCFISSRNLTHISSSAIRMIEKAKSRP